MKAANVKEILNQNSRNSTSRHGDCAAPVVAICFENKWKPSTMAEFWYGKSPQSRFARMGIIIRLPQQV
jgi:hypothetical protein